MKAIDTLRSACLGTARSLKVFLTDVGHGMLEISHNTLALVGLGVVALAIVASGHGELRTRAEAQALEWLQGRQEARALQSGDVLTSVARADAVSRATAIDPAQLTRQQAAVARWIARRYKVAPEPVARLVQEAWHIGQRAAIEPTLILAIMAVESSFNPFAQSPVGAQGLMQVMTRVHDDKYEAFGGVHAAFDPVSNLRVGVQVLKDCLARAGGNMEEALRFYVGAAGLDSDGGYVNRVLGEQTHLRAVAEGRSVPANAPAPGTERETPSTAQTAASQVALLRRDAAAPALN
ncbi:MAG: lytic transglycosylase domain-containing protein [Rubrivivax sp.]|nr:lytic transglycosylase domain-containing protein [Rubrivivax sp.]